MSVDYESLKDKAVVLAQSGVTKAKELTDTGIAKAKELANAGAAKARELSEIGKLKVQNSTEQEAIRKAYSDLGKLYYAEHGSAPEAAFADLPDDELIAQEEIPEELPEEIDGGMEGVDEPILVDHPDLDPEPVEADMTEALVGMEERAGIGTYVSEEAMPVNARVLVKPDAEEIGAVEKKKKKSREPVGKA